MHDAAQANSTCSAARRRRRPRRGSVLLEAALVLPVLLIVVFGAIEFGWAFYIKHSLQGAAYAGARAAIVPGATNSDVTSAVSLAMQRGGLQGATYTVSIKDGNSQADTSVGSMSEGDAILVEVDAPWSQFSVFVTSLSGHINGNLSGRAVMRREG